MPRCPVAGGIFRAEWTRRGTGDSLALLMSPESSTSTASVGANILPPDLVATTYGVAGPASGDVAVVLQFNDAVDSGAFGSFVGYKALQSFQITRRSGLTFVVIGANGSGCYSLTSDAWTAGLTTSTALIVSLQRP